MIAGPAAVHGASVDQGRGVGSPVVYLVTAEPAGKPMIEVATAAVAGGVGMVQLRDKHAATSARISMLKELRARLAGSGATLLVNDDLNAARAVHGVGVHLGPDDLPPATARAELGPEACIGWSIHHQAQLADGDALAAIDYLVASPVWSTPTKTDTTPPFELSGVRDLRAAVGDRMRLFGIGGIGADNAASVIEAGADGIAVVSAICSASDPSAAAAALHVAVQQGRAGTGGG